MCGIAGWFEQEGHIDTIKLRVATMVAAQRHRGPDSEGTESVSNTPAFVMGQARLSIIDLSPEAQQPMFDPETGNVIVFNGEIYNFKTLRYELEKQGCRFRTQTDTEVILKAYSKWGDGCCKKLRGIFAFALWDTRLKAMLLARDPMGVKPLYYVQQHRRFVFASEVRALLAGGAVEAQVDLVGLDTFLAYGSVQEPFTLVKGVMSMPPAHFAWITDPEKMQLKRYWMPIPLEQYIFTSIDAAQEAVHSLLKEAVQLQMVSDVPLGAFLSGGVDSSAIVALMRQAYDTPIKTFSIVFEDPKFDERRYSAQVARVNDTEHHELELTGAMVKSELHRALNALDQPSIDGLNTWFVSKLVKEAGVTVALSGVGGDELFVGYGGFDTHLRMQTWQKAFRLLPRSFGRILQSVSRNDRCQKMGQRMGYAYPGYFLTRQVFSAYQRRLLVSGKNVPVYDWFSNCFGEVLADSTHCPDEIARISLFEMRTYMLSTLLRDTDQMSMAHSLEVRVPLIDSELVTLMLTLPGAFKKSPGIPKPLLVAAAGKGLPWECVDRPKKGFTFPFDQFIRDSLGDEMKDFFHQDDTEMFTRQGLRQIWADYQAGRVSWSRIWALFVLGYWIKKHIRT